MKIEVRCGACWKRYLVDSESLTGTGGQVSCPACGATIEIPGAAPPLRAPAPPPATEVNCPRCGLHFVPATHRDVPTPATRPTVLVVTAQDEAEMYGAEWQRLSTLGVSDVVRKGMNMSEMLLRKVGAALGKADPQGTLRD